MFSRQKAPNKPEQQVCACGYAARDESDMAAHLTEAITRAVNPISGKWVQRAMAEPCSACRRGPEIEREAEHGRH